MAQIKETGSEKTVTKSNNTKKQSAPDIRITVNDKPVPQSAVTVTRGKDGAGRSVRLTRTTISLRQEAAARFPPMFSYSPRVFIYGILAVSLIMLTVELANYASKVGPQDDELDESMQKLFMTSSQTKQQGPDNVLAPQEEETINLDKLQGNLDMGLNNEQHIFSLPSFFGWLKEEESIVQKQRSGDEKSVEGNDDKKEGSVPVPPRENEHAYNSLEKEFEDKPEKADLAILGPDDVDGEKEEDKGKASKMKLVLINPKAEKMLAPGEEAARLKYSV